MAGRRVAVARPVGDQELAQELGAEFGLGSLEGVTRLRPGVAADLVAGCRALLRGRRPRPEVTARLFRYSGGLAHFIVIGRRGAPSETVYAGGLSNGIFLPAVLARAAAAHRVVVTGYHGDGGGIPARWRLRGGPDE